MILFFRPECFENHGACDIESCVVETYLLTSVDRHALSG